jgi:hypothetical protein
LGSHPRGGPCAVHLWWEQRDYEGAHRPQHHKGVRGGVTATASQQRRNSVATASPRRGGRERSPACPQQKSLSYLQEYRVALSLAWTHQSFSRQYLLTSHICDLASILIVYTLQGRSVLVFHCDCDKPDTHDTPHAHPTDAIRHVRQAQGKTGTTDRTDSIRARVRLLGRRGSVCAVSPCRSALSCMIS